MNWNKIKENHPKAFDSLAKFTGNIGRVAEPVWYLEEDFNSRDLYDFFDSNSIRCFVIEGWGYEIMVDEADGEYSLYDINGDWVNTRTEAEGQAFSKAFEILEEKLNA